MHIRRAVTAALAAFFLSISAEGAERYTVPFFPAPGASGDPQGVLRIVNDSGEAATVEVFAIADDGTRSGPATVALDAASAAEFDATELRSANAAKGLSGGLGSFSGDVRLSIASDVAVAPLAFVRAADGSLSAMHDTVRAASSESGGDYRYNVPIFNLSTAVAQASRLRLINPGDTPAAVAIGGRDDGGSATMGTVQLSLPAGGARTLTAQQLEAGGAGLTGTLGAGIGRWRLSVSSDRPLRVVNIAVSPTGHRNNLSTTAVRGAAPADRAGFDDRFAGESAVLETEGGLAVTIAGNGRFSATLQSDGMVATDEGGYDYAGLGPDAGRLTLDYDGGTRCLANLYFSSRTSGWFASHCTGGGDPDTWSGGNWFVGEDEGGDGGAVETTYGMDEALPGVGSSFPGRVMGGSAVRTGGSTTIDLNEGGYFELDDGTRYTCAAAGGCEIVDGTVTRGTITGTAAGTGEVDRFPTFRTATNPGNRTYAVGTAIDALTLPEATGGNGPLTYSLSPNVPGLMFNPTARRLDGTPSTAGSYPMRYTVRDVDGDTDTLRFTVTVSDGDGETGSLGVCEVGMRLSSGQSCTYPGTTDEFSVNARGRGSFLDRLAGIRIRIDNETISGQVYDFEASHQGEGVWRVDRLPASAGDGTGGDDGQATTLQFDLHDDNDAARGLAFANGRFYVVDYWDEYVYAYNASGGRDTMADFDLDIASSFDGASGITHANDRFYVAHRSREKVYAYTASGGRDSAADFDLASDNANPRGIAHANGRLYVTDGVDRKVYAYTISGGRDSGSDFDLHGDNGQPGGIVYGSGSGRFFVVDWRDDKVYAYTASGIRDPAADFDLDLRLGNEGFGIAYTDDRLYVVQQDSVTHDPRGNNDRVRSYPEPTGGTVTDSGGPDLLVRSVSVSDSTPSAGGSFTLSASVRNDGDAEAPATTLRYYRSADSTITAGDTAVGTDAVGRLAASGTSPESIRLTAPSAAGTYYYGACVDSVSGESATDNNCSSGVAVTVSGGGTGSDAPSGPRNISVTREGSNVRVTWDAAPGATHYEVWRCDTRDDIFACSDGIFFDRSNWTNLARNVTATSYLDRNPPTSTSIIPFDITYTVQACNLSGCSGPL